MESRRRFAWAPPHRIQKERRSVRPEPASALDRPLVQAGAEEHAGKGADDALEVGVVGPAVFDLAGVALRFLAAVEGEGDAEPGEGALAVVEAGGVLLGQLPLRAGPPPPAVGQSELPH